ncbi:MAG: glutaredoxin [Euryarchaeota archaeon]|jgi:glutaredoxin 3|nr:glutaredoxin [Euryarchaeota archaeon]|tara:strand:- start:4644 stop:4910 length:267 start_codon:yes stop_codon:yes gene_type:complete
MTQSVIYSKPNCPYCDKAKALLNKTQIEWQEIVIGKDVTVEQLFEEFRLNGQPQPKSAPQIIIHGKYVGGYTELQQYFENCDLGRSDT